MDVGWFLKQRTKFVRFLYEEGVKPFQTIQRQIEDGEPPFDDPPYDESGEPAFLTEWEEAKTATDVLGLSCVSLLSDALKLYFNALKSREIGFEFAPSEKKALKELGFVMSFKEALGEILETDWADCPADFAVIEQVVLARNNAQHGSNLAIFAVWHDGATLQKHPRPFFISEMEKQAFANVDDAEERSFVFGPILEVNRTNLLDAIEHIDKLADWIDGRMEFAGNWRAKMASQEG